MKEKVQAPSQCLYHLFPYNYMQNIYWARGELWPTWPSRPEKKISIVVFRDNSGNL